MRIRYYLVNIRKIGLLSVLLLCCHLGVKAQEFVDLTADEVRIDSLLPVYTWQKSLGRHYADSTYTVSIEYPEFEEMTKEEIDRCFEEFKDVCDKKKNITDADLEAIVTHHTASLIPEVDASGYALDWFQTSTSNFTTATCTISLKKNEEKF